MRAAIDPVAFLEKTNPDALALAVSVSIAARIEPELLRAMRRALHPGVDVSAEADLWLSELMGERTASFAVMDGVVAHRLRLQLARDRPRLKQAQQVLAMIHDKYPPALVVEEEITWRSLFDPDDPEIELLTRRVLLALSQGRIGLARWAARAVPLLPDAARLSAPIQRLAMAAENVLGDAILSGRQNATRLSMVVDTTALATVTTSVGFALYGRILQISHPPQPGSLTLVIPAEPLALQVECWRGRKVERAIVNLAVDNPWRVQIPEDASFRIVTVAGERYELVSEAFDDREAAMRAPSREPTTKPVGKPDAGNPHVRFVERFEERTAHPPKNTNAIPVRIALIDTTGTVRLQRLQEVAAAIEHQIRHDLGLFYDADARIIALRHGKSLPNRTWPVHIVPEANKDGGFHADISGAPFAKVYIGPHWTITASHQILEMVIDPTGSRLHTAPAIRVVNGEIQNARGNFPYLMEICGPCQSTDAAYTIDNVAVSDFITPQYFDRIAQPNARYSFNGSITAPRQVLKGGYLVWFNPRLGKMQMLRNLDRDPFPRIHTFRGAPPKRRSLREYVDGQLVSMRRLAVASWEPPIFQGR